MSKQNLSISTELSPLPPLKSLTDRTPGVGGQWPAVSGGRGVGCSPARGPLSRFSAASRPAATRFHRAGQSRVWNQPSPGTAPGPAPGRPAPSPRELFSQGLVHRLRARPLPLSAALLSVCPWSRPSLSVLPPASVRGKGAACRPDGRLQGRSVFILLGWGTHAVELVMRKECKDEYSGQKNFCFYLNAGDGILKGSGMQQVRSF